MEGDETEDFDGENKDEISGTEEKTDEAGEEVKCLLPNFRITLDSIL